MADTSADSVVDTLEVSKKPKPKAVTLPKELTEPRKMFFEEVMKIIIGVILVILFIALFIGIVWYFLIQLDATLFDQALGDATEVSNAVHILSGL